MLAECWRTSSLVVCLQAKTKIRFGRLGVFVFADDCALNAGNAADIQSSMDLLSSTARTVGCLYLILLSIRAEEGYLGLKCQFLVSPVFREFSISWWLFVS